MSILKSFHKSTVFVYHKFANHKTAILIGFSLGVLALVGGVWLILGVSIQAQIAAAQDSQEAGDQSYHDQDAMHDFSQAQELITNGCLQDGLVGWDTYGQVQVQSFPANDWSSNSQEAKIFEQYLKFYCHSILTEPQDSLTGFALRLSLASFESDTQDALELAEGGLITRASQTLEPIHKDRLLGFWYRFDQDQSLSLSQKLTTQPVFQVLAGDKTLFQTTASQWQLAGEGWQRVVLPLTFSDNLSSLKLDFVLKENSLNSSPERSMPNTNLLITAITSKPAPDTNLIEIDWYDEGDGELSLSWVVPDWLPPTKVFGYKVFLKQEEPQAWPPSFTDHQLLVRVPHHHQPILINQPNPLPVGQREDRLVTDLEPGEYWLSLVALKPDGSLVVLAHNTQVRIANQNH